MKGKKYDKDKLRYDLIPWCVEEEIAKVITHGADKYGENNWQNLENANARYYSALIRHIQEFRKGNLIDKDSGLSHLSHALCNVAFLLALNYDRD